MKHCAIMKITQPPTGPAMGTRKFALRDRDGHGVRVSALI